jgi:hypothetical protein
MNTLKNFLIAMRTPRKIVISRGRLIGAVLALTAGLATPLLATPFFLTTGAPNGKGALGALSRRPAPGKIETETADDFFLQETTVIRSATITGLVPAGTPLDNIRDVEVEIYHVFPLDSVTPPSNRVPSRTNSPSDVEIDTGTRARSAGTLSISATVVSTNFMVDNTVVNGISAGAGNEGPFSGEAIEITITFTSPIILPAGSYFFRPEVLLTNGDFLYLSGQRPIPGNPFSPDRQAWIRNANLAPDWLRIGTDIIGGAPTPPQFNMSFSLTGETVPAAGTPGQPNCHGQSTAALANQFGGIDAAASALGFSSASALHDGFKLFCE